MADPRHEPAPPVGGNGHNHRTWEELAVAEDHEGWVARSRVLLTPMMVGAWQGGWFGPASAPLVIWPLALFAGGRSRTPGWAGTRCTPPR